MYTKHSAEYCTPAYTSEQARQEGGVGGLATLGPTTFEGPGVGQKYTV